MVTGVVCGLSLLVISGAVAYLITSSLRAVYRREGYEQGAREQLEDELARKGKLIAGRRGLGR